ncbi:hypothetical protein ACQEVF_41830 [Nonomuraea polychroma]|uniref:hypothetical protein n=1 Tax=Nonomuraea polychroma TaxID=46176 RepID=UPI003D91F7E5
MMARYAVLLYERVPPDELPEKVKQAYLAMPGKASELGGRIAAGMALDEPETATSIRGDLVTSRSSSHRQRLPVRRDSSARPRASDFRDGPPPLSGTS